MVSVQSLDNLVEIILQQKRLNSDDRAILLGYVTKTPRIDKTPLQFAIKLSTQLDNILAEGPDNLLLFTGRIYRYNMETLERIERITVKENHADQRKVFAALNYALKALTRYSVRTTRYKTLVAYASAYRDKEENAYTQACLGEIARRIFKKTTKMEWAYKWHSRQKRAAKLFGSFNKRQAAASYASAAKACKHIYKITKDKLWGNRAITHYQRHNALLSMCRKCPPYEVLIKQKQKSIETLQSRLAA